MLDIIGQKATEKFWEDFRKCFESEVAEEFLQSLLTLMQIVFVVNHDYRRNIKKFDGRYQFCSKDGEVTISETGILIINPSCCSKAFTDAFPSFSLLVIAT